MLTEERGEPHISPCERSRTPRSATERGNVDDVPVDEVHLALDRCRGRGRQRRRNGGGKIPPEPGPALRGEVGTQPSPPPPPRGGGGGAGGVPHPPARR